MAIHIAMTLALVETIALAAVLTVWAKQVPGVRLLTVFLLGVAAWIVGNELTDWMGLQAAPIALLLLTTVPLTSAAFLHFCFVFSGVPLGRSGRWLAYGSAVAVTALSLLVTPARFEHFAPFTGVQWVVVPTWSGWVTSLTWMVHAIVGMLVLALGFWRSHSPQRRRQIAAVAVSCGWGLMCMSGYAFAALKIPVYPWQVLAVPAYPLILVYGILRYQVFVANAWARRALTWAILIGLGVLVVPLMVLLPFESRWLTAVLVAVVSLALSGPVRRVAERLVYPGGTPSTQDLANWRADLARADSPAALGQRATALLSQRMGLAVRVRVGGAPESGAFDVQTPSLACTKGDRGWQTLLEGFDDAPPGPRHLAELFGATLAEVAAQVELATFAQQREREAQLQARLAELGSLAASVAHDLRNPLNIIAMAVAGTPADTRREVSDQITRISRLAEDLLDYAKPWQIRAADIDLALRVREAVRRVPGVELGPGLASPIALKADPQRVDQVLGNLLSNARSAAGVRHVWLDAERAGGMVCLHICDDGPGVPADLRDRLFQPFASRSPGGTGLGLAIVARIMAAHGGAVALTERPPWRTCFTLSFPVTS